VELIEHVTGTEEIFSGRVVHLRVDTVRLPDGRESKREIVAHPGAVCIVPAIGDNEVLMVRQFRLAAGKTLLEIPAGTLEAGEDPLACAHRELKEETGYSARHMKLLFSAYLAPGYSTELIHAYLAIGLFKCDEAGSMDVDENIALEKISLADIVNMIMDGKLQDSKSIASILTALRVMEQLAG
jgi:8-oxo-dGTP pyrophosphatase MutT (NUDIX family)